MSREASLSAIKDTLTPTRDVGHASSGTLIVLGDASRSPSCLNLQLDCSKHLQTTGTPNALYTKKKAASTTLNGERKYPRAFQHFQTQSTDSLRSSDETPFVFFSQRMSNSSNIYHASLRPLPH
jgi:hypothetical protein